MWPKCVQINSFEKRRGESFFDLTQRPASTGGGERGSWSQISRGVRHFRNLAHFSKKPGETSRILTKSRRIPKNPQGFWRNPEESQETPRYWLHRILKNPLESLGIHRNPQESLGISRNPENPQEFFPDISSNLVQNFRSVDRAPRRWELSWPRKCWWDWS